MKRESYVSPKAEVIQLEECDVICQSGGTGINDLNEFYFDWTE